MLFNSLEFILVFLPITLLGFFLIGRRGYYQLTMAWLVVASLIFYLWWNPAYLTLLISSVIFNYIVGSSLTKRWNLPININNKLLLTIGIVVNLALIGYYKYTNFFISTFNNLVGTEFNLQKIILPLAISFFTFQQIAYLVDAYRGETQEYNFLKYSLFVTFFPQLIAGPIVHHKDVMPQFADKSIYKFNPEDMSVGITIFVMGLFKKVVIADTAALYATPVFNAAIEGSALTFYDGWSGALFYTLQLYFDFSGYSEMAIGAARMFGIKLPLNFNSPYKAVNIIDFWRRWHITLSNFLRDYLYIPLGGNRQGEIRRNINLMITMLLGGLWHGAGWTFVFWGGLHGSYLIINHQWRWFRKSILKHDLKKINWWSRIIGCLITFVAVVIGWVFFRAENWDGAINLLTAMIGLNGISLSPSVVSSQKQLLLGLLILVWFLPNVQQWMKNYEPALYIPETGLDLKWGANFWQKLQWRPTSAIGIIFGLLIFLIVKIISDAPQTEFLYFNF